MQYVPIIIGRTERSGFDRKLFDVRLHSFFLSSFTFCSRGVISGAKTTDYLLEKSRVCTQAEGERNYHSFYEILVGLGDEEKAKFGLAAADDYFYLNQVS